MRRLLAVFGCAGLAASALTLSSFHKTFEETYKVSANSALGTAKCMVCHMSQKGGKLNAYGKDVQAAMKAAGTKKLTADILKKVEGLDSDKNGVKNGDQIRSGKTPS